MIGLYHRGLSCLTLSFCCLDRVLNLDQYELFFEVDDSNGASVSCLVDFLCRVLGSLLLRHCFYRLGLSVSATRACVHAA